MHAPRTDVIDGLRALADHLLTNAGIPTPRALPVVASLQPGHSFTNVLNLCVALSPCRVEKGWVAGKRALVRDFGAVQFRVLVDDSAVGEMRTVPGHPPMFFVDSEVIRLTGTPAPCCQLYDQVATHDAADPNHGASAALAYLDQP